MANEINYTGHTGKGGLQGHSVGAQYPFCVMGTRDGWKAVNLVTGWEGAERAKYKQADADVSLQQLKERIRDKCTASRGYALGYSHYMASARTPNPFPVSSPEYGKFGKGWFDARRLQSMLEASEQSYSCTGMTC